MRILVVDQCSAAKDVPSWFGSWFDADEIDEHGLEALRERRNVPALRARHLYQGRQQEYISDAVDRLRESSDKVDRVFISAGFGLVDEDMTLPPYDVTFAELNDSEIDARAESLGIQEDLLEHLEGDLLYDVVFLALGRDYYRSLDLEQVIQALPGSTIGVIFNQEELAAEYDNVVSIPARTPQAKEHETIAVALKGRYLQYFAEHRSHGVTVESPERLRELCTSEYTTQTGLEGYET